MQGWSQQRVVHEGMLLLLRIHEGRGLRIYERGLRIHEGITLRIYQVILRI